MSSDYISSVYATAIPAPQGGKPTSSVSAQHKATEVERNKSAAAGQNLPPKEVEQSEDQAQVESAVSKISDYVQNFQRDLQFSVDKDSGRIVVKVLDSATKEVIRTIPREETLRMAQNLDSPESLILREQA